MSNKNKFLNFQLLGLFLLIVLYFYNFHFFYILSKEIIWKTIYFLNIKNPLSWGRYFFVFLGNLFFVFVASYGYSSLIFKFEINKNNLKIFCLYLPFTVFIPILKGIYFFFQSPFRLPIGYLIISLEIVSILIGILISLNFYFKLKNLKVYKKNEVWSLYKSNLNLNFFLISFFLLALSAYIETFYLYTHILKYKIL